MLNRLQSLAIALYPLRHVLAGAGILALLLTVFLLTRSDSAYEWLVLPAVIATLWSLTVFTLCVTFADTPPSTFEGGGWWRRVKHRLARLYHWTLALVFLATSIGAFIVTVRVLLASMER
ncbi:MAG: hypothetical protein K0U93_05380 [Gammaproteobacteria bacterium]|nr:hypothetical protein [Gammaproteobacteria bacterium]